jgi:hypothetical protein
MNNSIERAAPREHSERREDVEWIRLAHSILNARQQRLVFAQTSTAAARAIWADQMPVNTSWTVYLVVNAYAVTDGSAGYYERSVRIKRTTGAPTVVATATPTADNEDVAGWDITIAAAADGVITVSVTGDASRTVDWTAWVVVQETPRRT